VDLTSRRGKPVFQPCQAYHSGNWFEQQHSGYSLSVSTCGCAADGNGLDLSVRETSGPPAETLVLPKESRALAEKQDEDPLEDEHPRARAGSISVLQAES